MSRIKRVVRIDALSACLLGVSTFFLLASPVGRLIDRGLTAHFVAMNQRREHHRYVTLIDYTKPVVVKRLWVVELTTGRTVLTSHVFHALNSGLFYATKLSNVEGSEMSCVGSFVTQATYQGRFGYSLRVQGLDAKNSNTLRRSIVFHSSLIPIYSQGY